MMNPELGPSNFKLETRGYLRGYYGPLNMYETYTLKTYYFEYLQSVHFTEAQV